MLLPDGWKVRDSRCARHRSDRKKSFLFQKIMEFSSISAYNINASTIIVFKAKLLKLQKGAQNEKETILISGFIIDFVHAVRDDRVRRR
jgi:hypothetical protein